MIYWCGAIPKKLRTNYHGRKIQRVSQPVKHGKEHRFGIRLCRKRLQIASQGVDKEESVALQNVSHRDLQAQDREPAYSGIEQVS